MIMEILNEYWQVFAALGGVAVFVPALVGVLKIVDIVKEGEGARWQAAINAVLFVLFVGVKLFAPDFPVDTVDGILQVLAAVLVSLVNLFGQILISKGTYAAAKAKNVPVFGKSYS